MEHLNDLTRRYTYCTDSFGNTYQCNSAWTNWARWVVLGVIVVAFFVLFFLCSCISSRRRRRAGRQPFYGTGWAGRTPFGHGQAQYNPSYQTQQQPAYGQTAPPPPEYNPNQGGYYGGSGGEAQSYYAGGRDVEMQPPENAYRAPPGPPPDKQ